VKRLRILLAFAILLSVAAPVCAQGCSLCRDTTAGSAPRARQTLRRAILVMAIPAGSIFVGILVIARKMNAREGSNGSRSL